MASFLPMAAQRSTTYLVVVVLPQPGPPVRMQTGEKAAVRMASICPSDSCMACPGCIAQAVKSDLDCSAIAASITHVLNRGLFCQQLP